MTMNTRQLRSTYQLKISLEGTKPPIWRRLLVSSDIKLDIFHLALQITMGWNNSHLHHFISQEQKFYGIKDDDFEVEGFEMHDESATRLSKLLKIKKDSLIYEYDFGDGWMHKVLLEKTLPFDPAKKAALLRHWQTCLPTRRLWWYLGLCKFISDTKQPRT